MRCAGTVPPAFGHGSEAATHQRPRQKADAVKEVVEYGDASSYRRHRYFAQVDRHAHGGQPCTKDPISDTPSRSLIVCFGGVCVRENYSSYVLLLLS